MSTSTLSKKSRLRWSISDTLTIAKRDLIALIRTPTTLVFAVIQPIMFVVLFRYVFGGAIKAPGISYVNFLIPGILVQNSIFGAVGTAIGLAEDLQKGLIERFRALPMARMAVMGGRTVADLARNLMVIVVVTIVGFLVGFRPTGSFVSYIQACLLMLLFSYCLSWGFAIIGLAAPNSEAAQAMTFPLIFPLTFASSIFVPVLSMPSWLQVFARNQPVSKAADAVRGLMIGQPHGYSTWVTVIYAVIALCLLGPIATAKYKKVA